METAEETVVTPETMKEAAPVKEPSAEDILGRPSIRISNKPLAPLSSDEENEKKKKPDFDLDENGMPASSSKSPEDEKDFELKKNESVREVLHRMWGVDLEGIEGVKRAKTFDQKAYKGFWFNKNSIAFEANDGQAFWWHKNQDGSETIARYMNKFQRMFNNYTSEDTAMAMVNVAYQRNIFELHIGPEAAIRERDVMWFAAQMKTLHLIQGLKENSLNPETGNDALTGVEKFKEMVKLSPAQKEALSGPEKEILNNAHALEALKTVKIAGYVPLREAKLMKKFMNELSQQPPDIQEAFYLKTGIRAPGAPGMEQNAEKAAANDASAAKPETKEQLALPAAPEMKLLNAGDPSRPDIPTSKFTAAGALPPHEQPKALGAAPQTKFLPSGYEGLPPEDAAWLKTMRENLDTVRSGSDAPLKTPGVFNKGSPAVKTFLQELSSQPPAVQESFMSKIKQATGQPIGEIASGIKALPEAKTPKQLKP